MFIDRFDAKNACFCRRLLTMELEIDQTGFPQLVVLLCFFRGQGTQQKLHC